ncbi:efflux RND transporter permease subunit [Halalkalibacterium ligniniphilum]|uniref:efflux RND transporter permease subunit n=1 Tax=Halalkalibacterium ligniniphilum TaxID=1134413 RepID=UPI000344DBCF|nr:efflux RND transporter permease subunit [Halalkalibacterium ligniniphilum]
MTNFSIRRPIFTIVGMIIFLLLGAISYTNLPLQLTPDISPPIGAVTASYPGASAEEVAETVTLALEEDLATTSGLSKITSQTMEGNVIILLEFGWTTNIDDVENEILSTISRTSLPDGANDPNFLKFDPSNFPIIELVATSSTGDIQDIQAELDDLQQELARIEGVASISETGRLSEQVQVTLDQNELEQYGLAQQDILDLIEANDVSLPGGTISDGTTALTTRVISTIDSLETLENLVLTIDPQSGDNVTLADVATVAISTEDEDVITRANQDPAIQLSIMREDGANSVDVSVQVQKKIDELLAESQYDDVEILYLFDEGDFVQQAVDSVLVALIAGGAMAMAVLFLFLRNLKTPLIIGVAIPFSVIVTFAFLYFTGISLNILSLGGLALGIGMLVDNSIVVIENIYRHLAMGKKPREAALDGTREVRGAITAATLTTIVVFVPILFLSGIVGELFIQFATTVSLSLFASLLVAITIVPLMASRMLKPFDENVEKKRQKSRFIRGVEKGVAWSLRHRALVLVTTVLLFVGGAYGMTTVGVNFLDDMDEGYFAVDISLEQGTSLERTAETVEAVEEILNDYSEIENYLSVIGSSGVMPGMGGGSGSHEAQIQVSLVPSTERSISTVEFVESIKREVERADQEADIQAAPFSLQGSEPNTLVFYLSDPDTERLTETVNEVEQELLELSEVTNVALSTDEASPEYQLLIDREAAREHGLAPGQIAQFVNQVTLGQTVTTMDVENQMLDIFVRYDKEVLESLENVENLSIRNNEGQYISLGEVVEIERGEGPATINRVEQVDAVEFTVTYVSSISLGGISTLVEEVIDDVGLDEATAFAYTGDRDALDTATNDLIGAFTLAVVFIFLVMAAQFESFRYPLVVMFSLPLILIGVSLSLIMTNTSFSVMAAIGVIILAGIAVNNAIVLVDYMNQQKQAGLPTYDAIIEAVKHRTRPVLMTALTTILGVLPMALAIGEGTEMQRPIGIVVIGGLISATFLTLFVIPVIYSLFDKETRRLNKKYLTPDGQLIPAYLLEQRLEQDQQASPEEKELEARQERKQISQSTDASSDLSKEDILYLLERIVDRSKSESTQKEKDEEPDEKDNEKS